MHLTSVRFYKMGVISTWLEQSYLGNHFSRLVLMVFSTSASPTFSNLKKKPCIVFIFYSPSLFFREVLIICLNDIKEIQSKEKRVKRNSEKRIKKKNFVRIFLFFVLLFYLLVFYFFVMLSLFIYLFEHYILF